MLAGLETAICYQMTMSSLSSMAAVQKPNAGAKVKLRYEARLMDGTLFDERGEGNELEAVMEEGTKRTLAHDVSL